MSSYVQNNYFTIDFGDGCEPIDFGIQLDFYVYDGSGRKLPATTRIECYYDPMPDETYDEPYFAANIGRRCFDGPASQDSAYLVLDDVMLEELCPELGYSLPPELNRFKVCMDINVHKGPEGGGYLMVRVWVYQMVLVYRAT
jgi:hypothetical protein